MKYRIAHLTTVHPPTDTRILVKECQSLAHAGYDVTFIHLGAQSEIVGQVRIVGLAFSPRNRLDRILRGSWKVFKRTLTVRYDCIHIHDPELLPLGAVLRALGRPVIYDAHEDLPAQLLSKPYIKRSLRVVASRVLGALETLFVLTVSGVIAATPAIARRHSRKRCSLVQNFPLLREFDSPPREPYRGRDVVYVGGISEIRGIHLMVKAMEHLSVSDCKLVLIGEFQSDKLYQETISMPGWGQVKHLGWQDRTSVVENLSNSLAGLAIFLPVPNHVESRPNKIFEYMAAGLPVIASDFPSWREIIGAHSCGLLVDPSDPLDIAAAIRSLLDDTEMAMAMGERGRRSVQEIYNWESESKKLLRFYERILI